MDKAPEQTLVPVVLFIFMLGLFLGWRANTMRQRFLHCGKQWFKSQLAETQKKTDLV